jgi:hypothetical protein
MSEAELNEALDWLLINDLVSVSWDEDGIDYYSVTEKGETCFNLLVAFKEDAGDDGYQVC